MQERIIGNNDAGQRLDKFLSKAFPDLPFSLLYKSVRTKKIKVNRKRAVPSQILSAGDCLQLFLRDELLGNPEKAERGALLRGIRMRPTVLYEDENILLLDKPIGLSVHEDEGNKINNLLLQLQAYLFERGEYDPDNEQSFAPALCNRIDRNTAGIVIAAKNAEALRLMNEMIKARKIDKFYLCAVHGHPNPEGATRSAYLLKNADENTVRIFDKDPPRGALSIKTRYRTLAKEGDLSLLEVELLTGRTHQIRAHMAHLGHPLLGDGKYGVNRLDREKGYRYQALCSYRLRFSFGDEGGALSYLSGKEFSLSPEAVWFLKEFPNVTL